MITQLPTEEAITRFTDCMDKICKMAKRVCKAKITAGIGHVCSGPEELQMSYLGAKNAVSYRVLYGNIRAINIAEIDPQESADLPWEEPFIQKIIKKVKVGEEQPLLDAIAEFAEKLAGSKMSLQRYRILIMELITELSRFGANNQINLEDVFGGNGGCVYTRHAAGVDGCTPGMAV